MPILILTGPPGAGKSTVARLLALRRPRAVHLECDRFFDFIASGYVEPWRPESHGQNTLVMRIAAQAAAAYATAGYFTVIDGIVLPRWFLAPLRERLEREGHAVAYAVLAAPLEVCLARAAGRAAGAPADPGVVAGLWRDFADLGELGDHAVDSGERAPQAVADDVASRDLTLR